MAGQFDFEAMFVIGQSHMKRLDFKLRAEKHSLTIPPPFSLTSTPVIPVYDEQENGLYFRTSEQVNSRAPCHYAFPHQSGVQLALGSVSHLCCGHRYCGRIWRHAPRNFVSLVRISCRSYRPIFSHGGRCNLDHLDGRRGHLGGRSRTRVVDRQR